MTIQKIIFGFLVSFLLLGSWSFACTYIPQTWEETFEESELVVSGKIISKEEVLGNSGGLDPDEQLQFKIYELNKGFVSGDLITLVSSSSNSCGTTVKSGGLYTLYLGDNSESKYYPAHYLTLFNTRGRTPIQPKQSIRTQILNFFNTLF